MTLSRIQGFTYCRCFGTVYSIAVGLFFFFSAVNASSHILPRIGLTLKTDDGLNTDLGVPTMTDALLTSLSRYAGLYYFKRSIVSLHLMLKAPLI